MEHNITLSLAKAFIRRAAAMGYDVKTANAEHDHDLCMTAFLGKNQICEFGMSGSMRYLPDNPLIAERKQLHALLLDMKMAHDLYADGKPLEVGDIDKEDGFRLISEFGNSLLAAKMGEDNEVRFTTWDYDYDRQGVHWGHYYETNYEGAKQDFAIRAGLIKESQLFTKEELVALHDACVFRGRNDDEISCEDDKRLQAVMEKVEENIPDLIFDREQPEQEASHGIQPD